MPVVKKSHIHCYKRICCYFLSFIISNWTAAAICYNLCPYAINASVKSDHITYVTSGFWILKEGTTTLSISHSNCFFSDLRKKFVSPILSLLRFCLFPRGHIEIMARIITIRHMVISWLIKHILIVDAAIPDPIGDNSVILEYVIYAHNVIFID